MLLIVGDFNYHVDDISDSEACSFTNLIDSFGFIQHVSDSTHRSGHTLDLMLSRSHDSLVLQTRPIACFLVTSAHLPVRCIVGFPPLVYPS